MIKNLKRLPFLFLIPALFACSPDQGPAEETAASKPNIVFLFADDLTYTAIHALGNEEIETPNLDRLVHNGTTFTHAYNMGGWNGAICIASRSMIISGRSVWRAKEVAESWPKGKALHQTWGKLMEAHGYDTYMTGKWHIAAPADTVFQTTAHIRPGMPPDAWIKRNQKKEGTTGYDQESDWPTGYNRPQNENDHTWSPTDTTFGGFWEGGKHWSEVLKDDALRFIDSAKEKENPFFMYLAFNAPHDPRQAPQEFIDKYPLDKISLPASFLPENPDKDAMGAGPGLRDEGLAPFPRTEYAVKVHLQEYYAIITHLDEQIGKILDALEQSGKMENTYIFFTADHGLSVGRHGLLGKQNLYDHSIRVPLMVAGPDIPENKKVERDIYLQDVMATSLELAGVQKPEYVEFNSFLDLAKGNASESHYDAVYGCYMDFQRMIRKDEFKLIVYPKAQKVLLFDLKSDPEEMNNLADDPAHAEKIASLFDELVKLQQNMGDSLDLNPVYTAIK